MSEKFYTILTNIGKSKIANFAINGEEVKFVKLKVGDGNGKYYNPIENQKDLINTVWEGKIGNIQIDKDNPNWIVLETIIPPEVGDFTIREYGAFDEEDNLLAISKCPETYKPTISNGSTKELIIKMILSVSNTESISFEVDPNIMLAKKSKVDEIDKKVNYTISQLKDCAKKDGTLQTGLNSEKLGGKLLNAIMQNYDIGNEDLNTALQSGAYRFNHRNPHLPNKCGDWGQLLVIRGSGDTITQIISDLGNQLFVRSGNPKEIGGGGNWSVWKQLATTERTIVTATPAPGKVISRQNIYIENKTLYLDVIIQRVNNIEFEIATHLLFSIPPTGINYIRTLTASHWSDTGLTTGSGSTAMLANGEVYIINQERNSKTIRISATFALEEV